MMSAFTQESHHTFKGYVVHIYVLMLKVPDFPTDVHLQYIYSMHIILKNGYQFLMISICDFPWEAPILLRKYLVSYM